MKALTPEQLDELRDDLSVLAEQFTAALASSEEGAKPVGLDASMGRISRMDAIQAQSIAKSNREGVRLRLKQIESALRRHASGEYGSCLECDEDMAYARLKARPEAVLCVACQERRESR